TLIETNGVDKSEPFLTTRTLPTPPAVEPRSVTKILPSGANAIDVGLVSPLTRRDLVNPEGKAWAASDPSANMPKTLHERERRIVVSLSEVLGIVRSR